MGCALAHVGGNWNNGSNAGLFIWNLNNSSSNSNLNIGGQTLIRLLVFLAHHNPYRLVKIRHKEQGLVGLHSKDLEVNKKGFYVEKTRIHL